MAHRRFVIENLFALFDVKIQSVVSEPKNKNKCKMNNLQNSFVNP